MVEALKDNDSLTVLDLSVNYIRRGIGKALMNGLSKNRSLNVLNLCNV